MKIAMTLLALAAFAPTVAAAACPMGMAIYEGERGFGLNFLPPHPSALSTSNLFELVLPHSSERMPGEVIWGNGETRPIGYLRHGCAPDEADYDKLEACTHWQGIVYGISSGVVGLLPRADEPAPEQVILANLGQQLRYSLAFTDLQFEDIPWDVFTLAGCAE